MTVYERRKLRSGRRSRSLSTIKETSVSFSERKIWAHLILDPMPKWRLFAKIILGYGHWLWRERWSQSPAGNRLRAMLWSSSFEEYEVASANRMVSLFDSNVPIRIGAEQHLLMGTPLGAAGYLMSVTLFGKTRCGFIVPPGETDIAWPNESPVALVTSSTRRIEHLTDIELVRRGYVTIPPACKITSAP
jgi:hypothetical protein